MNKSNIKIKQKYFFKTYLKNALLENKKEIIKRIEIIKNFNCNKYKALAKTIFIETPNSYIYQQSKYQIIKKESYHKNDFIDLVKALEYFEAVGFVHGDINKKNIIYTIEGFKIIDYEPSLVQMRNKKIKLLITIPYVDKIELQNRKITSKTDKIGFFYFLLRITNKLSSSSIVKLSKTLDYSIIKYNLSEVSYFDILDYVFDDNIFA